MGQERYKGIVSGILARCGIGLDFEKNEEADTWEGKILQAMNDDLEVKNSDSKFLLREEELKVTYSQLTNGKKDDVVTAERILGGVQTGEREANLTGIKITEHKPEACGPFWRALEEYPIKVIGEVVKENKKSRRGGKTLGLAV